MSLTTDENRQFDSLYAILKEKKADCERKYQEWHRAYHELDLIERQISPLWQKLWTDRR